MSKTLRELEAKRATYVVQLDVQENDLRRTRDKFIEDERIILSIIGDYLLEIADLDRAIAALTPAPDFIAEQETAREQLEREDVGMVEAFNEFQAELASQPDVDEPPGGPPIPASEWIEPQAGLAPDLDTGDDEQDDASEFAEPVEEAPALNEAMQDERTCTCHPSDRPFECMKQYAASECIAAFEAKYPSALTTGLPHPEPVEGYAPVTNPEAHIQAVEAERYALATNPEADALARAHDYYSPEKIAERGKFNPFSIFRREDA